MEKFSSAFISKLNGLLFFLKRSNKEFEMVADEMGHHSLRTALNGLSDESGYYAGELKDYLKTLGVSAPALPDEAEEIYGNEILSETLEGEELLGICTRNENKLVHAYNELLLECIPFQSLKDIMLYQLSALKYSFMKIKTLNTARFSVY